jgi:hypothetical protein
MDRTYNYLEEDENEEYYDQIKEEESWQETLLDIKKSPCIKCGSTDRYVDYNTHDNKYSTFDTICRNCGHIILSLLD